MAVLMFLPRFHRPILDGTKRQTIRGVRKRPIVVGERLSLRAWSGQPYRSPQVILAERRLAAVHHVRIVVDGLITTPLIALDGVWLYQDERELFAKADGFASTEDMCGFWRSVHGDDEFEGHVYQWVRDMTLGKEGENGGPADAG
jgi:hypothetical protein